MTDTFSPPARHAGLRRDRTARQKFLLEPAEFQGHTDPHVWMDAGPKEAVKAVARRWARDPAQAERYTATGAVGDRPRHWTPRPRRRGEHPKHHRVLITAHDAFNYFGRHGLDVQGIQGSAPNQPGSPTSTDRGSYRRS
jgi:ABC-type Zn uptake system ZnuABC Zn-binding protein ZnuA